jgi:hypothetical protein
MHSNWRAASVVALTLLSSAIAFSGTAAAQTTAATKEYTPSVGQEGKDVIWVPTPQSLVDRMLTMAGVKPTDYVIDLGSGDGRTVITAAKKFGAPALGIEYNPDMVELAKRAAEKEGVAGKAQFVKADIFQTDFSKATVLTMYLLPSLNVKLRPTILNLKPGTRIVSHAFTMDDWQPDQVDSSEGRTAYMWIVPAKVAAPAATSRRLSPSSTRTSAAARRSTAKSPSSRAASCAATRSLSRSTAANTRAASRATRSKGRSPAGSSPRPGRAPKGADPVARCTPRRETKVSLLGSPFL